MIHDWLAEYGIVIGPAVVVVSFMVFFIGLVAWLHRPGSTEGYLEEANLPFDDGQIGVASGQILQGEGHGSGNR